MVPRDSSQAMPVDGQYSTAAARPAPVAAVGPCGDARVQVDRRCAEAERLGVAAAEHAQRLRDAKHRLAEISSQRQADAQVRDRRQLGELKEQARAAYHASVIKTGNDGSVQDAAAGWLREIDRLNRQVDLADRRSEAVIRQAAELEHALPGIELAADAARIAAEAAQVSCLEARRGLAACEEETQRRSNASPTAAPTAESPKRQAGPPPISLMLRGDRQALLSLALKLAEESGVEAGRLQLLLLELREAIADRALEEHTLRFPPDHPFWGQFSAADGRAVAASLSALSYRFDGRGGWVDGRAPAVHELALALSHCGHDPRSLRRPAGQAAIDGLWQGTQVLVEDFLAHQAPDLALPRMIELLGPRGARLSELWDLWGRLRPLLLPSPG